MIKYRSPGQKRLLAIRIISVIIFIVITGLAALVYGGFKLANQDWVDDHLQAEAIITATARTEEQYRNLRGRMRTRNLYTVSYQFTLGENQTLSNTIEVRELQFANFQKDQFLTVWYSAQDPSVNALASVAESQMKSNTLSLNVISVIPYTLLAMLFLYALLKLVFVREGKKQLPTGFYTETSWLDVDDKQVVAIKEGNLVNFDIRKGNVGRVQAAYQNNQSLETLTQLAKPSRQTVIPLTDIEFMQSDHNGDTIDVRSKDKRAILEFLNSAVKDHALQQLTDAIPAKFSHRLIKRNRFQASRASLIFLLILLSVIYFVDIFAVSFFLGIIAIFAVLPKVFSRLIDPHQTHIWALPDSKPSGPTA